MDVRFELNGVSFTWDQDKARANASKHDGVVFERAAEVFFDRLFRLVDADSNNEARDAVIGYDTLGRLLFRGPYRILGRTDSYHLRQKSDSRGAQ